MIILFRKVLMPKYYRFASLLSLLSAFFCFLSLILGSRLYALRFPDSSLGSQSGTQFFNQAFR